MIFLVSKMFEVRKPYKTMMFEEIRIDLYFYRNIFSALLFNGPKADDDLERGSFQGEIKSIDKCNFEEIGSLIRSKKLLSTDQYLYLTDFFPNAGYDDEESDLDFKKGLADFIFSLIISESKNKFNVKVIFIKTKRIRMKKFLLKHKFDEISSEFFYLIVD